MKIYVKYESGPARYASTSVDYMMADISALGLDVTELYAEVDPYSFLPQMGGAEKICEIYPEYAETIRECDPVDTDDLEDLATALERQDRDFDGNHFWDKMIEAFLWEADKFTEPHLRREIIAQAKALGISPDSLIFPS